MVKTLKKIPLFLFLILAFWMPHAPSKAAARDYLRVLIMHGTGSLSLKIDGDYRIEDPLEDRLLYSGSGLYATVTAAGSRILMGENSFGNARILVVPADEEAIELNGRRFRGEILLIREGASMMSVINYIGLEDYIQGVLYHEVSHYWPDEALKAQAIVARTYALYQMEQNGAKDFDVTSDIYSQVYGGRTSERYRLNRAVAATRGRVLTYRGRLLPAFYHASCGGHTQDASLVWKVDLAPLKGVVCPFCKSSPHFNWHYVLSLEEISQKLKETGIDTGGIKDIAIAARDSSGRVTGLIIALKSGASVSIPARDLRSIIGSNLVRSTNFTVSISGGDAVFEGLGWGHGVGFCQWGGYFMARRGDSCERILNYYYPGVVIARRPEADCRARQ